VFAALTRNKYVATVRAVGQNKIKTKHARKTEQQQIMRMTRSRREREGRMAEKPMY